MTGAAIFYFAYGSNMLSSRLQAADRCPSAKPLGIATLSGHELRWHKRSRDGSGKCDIVAAAPDTSVFGVLYEIAGNEKDALNRAEGFNKGYEEIEVEITLAGRQIASAAYRATDTDPERRPYTWYRALVVAGAREHCFPATYISQLEATPADEDTDRERHNKNMALIGRIRS